jgi:hypothetical protein
LPRVLLGSCPKRRNGNYRESCQESWFQRTGLLDGDCGPASERSAAGGGGRQMHVRV